MSKKKNQNEHGLRNINTFMSAELNSLKKEFKENGFGELSVFSFKEKTGDYYFITFKKIGDKISKEEFAEGISKDPFHAKAKMIEKLREVLKAMKCRIKNPLHVRRYAFIY